jgi:hypothetical protein
MKKLIAVPCNIFREALDKPTLLVSLRRLARGVPINQGPSQTLIHKSLRVH